MLDVDLLWISSADVDICPPTCTATEPSRLFWCQLLRFADISSEIFLQSGVVNINGVLFSRAVILANKFENKTSYLVAFSWPISPKESRSIKSTTGYRKKPSLILARTAPLTSEIGATVSTILEQITNHKINKSNIFGNDEIREIFFLA